MYIAVLQVQESFLTNFEIYRLLSSVKKSYHFYRCFTAGKIEDLFAAFISHSEILEHAMTTAVCPFLSSLYSFLIVLHSYHLAIWLVDVFQKKCTDFVHPQKKKQFGIKYTVKAMSL